MTAIQTHRHIIEAIEVGQGLGVGFVLDELFCAAMEQADVLGFGLAAVQL